MRGRLCGARAETRYSSLSLWQLDATKYEPQGNRCVTVTGRLVVNFSRARATVVCISIPKIASKIALSLAYRPYHF